MRLPLLVLALLACNAWGVSDAVAWPVRQLGPHVHGVASLDIAVADGALQIDLSMPGANAVGFEHPPQDAEQQKTLDRVIEDLESPAGWLMPATAARCSLLHASVQRHGYDPQSPGGEGHADIHASYRYQCAAADALRFIDVHLADRYPATHLVAVNLILPQRQDRKVLEGKAFRVDLTP